MDTEAHNRKPMVEGMYTIHRDYKYGKNKLDPAEKQRRQHEQRQRVASKRTARNNGCDILEHLARPRHIR